LRQAVNELGHVPEEFGVSGVAPYKASVFENTPHPTASSLDVVAIKQHKYLWSCVSAAAVFVVGAAIASTFLWQQHQEEIAMEEQAEILQDVLPASGGEMLVTPTVEHPY
jgi:hypothetical protein